MLPHKGALQNALFLLAVFSHAGPIRVGPIALRDHLTAPNRLHGGHPSFGFAGLAPSQTGDLVGAIRLLFGLLTEHKWEPLAPKKKTLQAERHALEIWQAPWSYGTFAISSRSQRRAA